MPDFRIDPVTHSIHSLSPRRCHFWTFIYPLTKEKSLNFVTQHFLTRISKRNYWVEADWNDCKEVTYGRFVAQAIVIGTIQG